MGILTKVWIKMTQTNALAQSSGPFETMFFESIYRVTYAAGFSSTDRGIYLVYSAMVKLLVAMIVIGEVWFVYSEYHSLGLDDIAASVNVIVIQMNSLYKIKNMIDHMGVYQRLANSMESPYFDISTPERQRLVKYWADTNERYLKLLLGLGSCTLLAWQLYPLFDELDYNLMVGVHLPFNFNTPQRYLFSYLVVGIAFMYTSYFVMLTDLIIQAYMIPLVCQLTVLADCFINIIGDSKEGIADSIYELRNNKEFIVRYLKRLGNLIDQHKVILSCTMDLQAIMSGPLLVQLGASGTLICFVAYQATATITGNITQCLMSWLYLGYNMFSFYSICRWCEEITVKSQNIGEAAYCSCWESGMSTIPGVRSTIIMVIARANKPVVFTAGGMYSLSLNAYTNLVKTSYSALTVLLRFRHD